MNGRRSAVGAALSVYLCADPTLLERGAATATQWIAEQGATVPPSVRDWQVLCLAGDMDSLLSVLHVWTVYADAMRASPPFVVAKNNAAPSALRAESACHAARALRPSRASHSIWLRQTYERALASGTHSTR